MIKEVFCHINKIHKIKQIVKYFQDYLALRYFIFENLSNS